MRISVSYQPRNLKQNLKIQFFQQVAMSQISLLLQIFNDQKCVSIENLTLEIGLFTLIPLIARNIAGWTFVCPRRNLVHPTPENNNALVLRYSADPLKAVSGLRLIPNPRAILKIRPPSLDYRACHGSQTIHSLHSYPLKSFYLRLLHCNNFTKARYVENDIALHSRY